MRHAEQAMYRLQRSAAIKLIHGMLMISCAAASLINALLTGY